jgi:hypothetical protein
MLSKLRRLSRWLRREYPLRRKVRILVLPPHRMPGLHGEMEIPDKKPNTVVIRIAQSTDAVMMETLIEEYSHAARYECPVKVENEHDHLFWAIYATITMQFRGGE